MYNSLHRITHISPSFVSTAAPHNPQSNLYVLTICAVALQDLKAAVAGLLLKLQQTTEVQVKQRQPLVRKPAARVADIKQYNPQFEEEYVAGKDYDPDRYAH